MIDDASVYFALVSFAFVASITPGPNNFMVMASGAAFGWRRTIPHMCGIAFGFAVMIGIVVLGLGAVLERFPQILLFLRVAGAGWLFWLAWQLARSALHAPSGADEPKKLEKMARPFTMTEAALFQWVNPKAWTMAIAASAAYSAVADDAITRALVFGATFIVIAPICNGVWVMAGQALQRLMTSGNSARYFSLVMAALVVMSAVLILLG